MHSMYVKVSAALYSLSEAHTLELKAPTETLAEQERRKEGLPKADPVDSAVARAVQLAVAPNLRTLHRVLTFLKLSQNGIGSMRSVLHPGFPANSTSLVNGVVTPV